MATKSDARTKWKAGEILPAFSSTTAWEDETWTKQNSTHGASKSVSTLKWRFQILNGENFIDPEFDDIRFACKALVWTLFNDRRTGKNLKPGSLGQVSVGIRYLTEAMVDKGVCSFDGITPEFVDSMLTDRANQIIDQEGDEALTEGRLIKLVSVCAYMWEQWSALKDFDVTGPPMDPLRGETAQCVAQNLARTSRGHIPAFSNHESLPILHAAWRMLTSCFEDVQKIQNIYLSEADRLIFQSGSTKNRDSSYRAIREALESFEFKCIDGASEPWRAPLLNVTRNSHRKSGIHIGPHAQLRRLIMDVSSAAHIIVQGTTGMRTSEICGLKNGWCDGLPACINIEQSIDGMLELFYISGSVSKDEIAPQATRWVVGCRPSGSNYLPAPVEALIAVQKLFEPWYQLSNLQNVFLSFTNRRGIPYMRSSISPIQGSQVARAQKEFIFTYVNNQVRDDGRFDIDTYRPHRWRKTFAFFIFRTDPSLLRAISTHFKHLSVAMTEQGYIGTDQFLLEDIDNARQNLANDFFAESIGGQRQVFGPFSKHIEKLKQSALENPETAEEERLRLADHLSEHDIRVDYSPHGKCMMSLFPEQARCREVLGDNSWSSRSPSFAVREPDVCLSCKCFAVDHEHREYWQERMVTSTEAYESLVKSEPNAAQIFNMRAKKARAILKALGNRQVETI